MCIHRYRNAELVAAVERYIRAPKCLEDRRPAVESPPVDPDPVHRDWVYCEHIGGVVGSTPFERDSDALPSGALFGYRPEAARKFWLWLNSNDYEVVSTEDDR